MNYWLLSIPIFTIIALVVFAMVLHWHIFYPIRPLLIGRARFQGLLPAFKERFINSVDEQVTSMFSSLPDKLDAELMMQQAMPMIESHMEEFLKNKLPVEMPMIGMFIGDKTIATLKEIFLREIKLMFPHVLNKAMDNQQMLDLFKDLVTSKFESYQGNHLSLLIKRNMKRVYICALLIGLFVAVIQVTLLFSFT